MTARKTATDPAAEQATTRAVDADGAAQDGDQVRDGEVYTPEPDSLDDLVQRVRRIETILL